MSACRSAAPGAGAARPADHLPRRRRRGPRPGPGRARRLVRPGLGQRPGPPVADGGRPAPGGRAVGRGGRRRGGRRGHPGPAPGPGALRPGGRGGHVPPARATSSRPTPPGSTPPSRRDARCPPSSPSPAPARSPGSPGTRWRCTRSGTSTWGVWQQKLYQALLLARIGPERFAALHGRPPAGSPPILPPGGAVTRLLETALEDLRRAAAALGPLATGEGGRTPGPCTAPAPPPGPPCCATTPTAPWTSPASTGRCTSPAPRST